MKFCNVGRLANRNLFPDFRELCSGGPVIPCGDSHESFTDTLVKSFFDKIPIIADSCSVLSIHCVGQGKILVLICLFCLKCTKFGQFIINKIIQIVPPDVRF